MLAGKTQPEATVDLNVTATRPVASLLEPGPFVLASGEAEQREISSSAIADDAGVFKLEFDVTGDPEQTEY